MRTAKIQLGLFGLSVIFVCIFLESVDGVEEMTCKQFVSGLTKRQINGISDCSRQLGFKTGKEKKEKMNCVLKCVMVNEKILNSEGLFDDEIFEQFITNEVPPNLVEKGVPLFRTCKDTVGKSLDPTEEYCKSYDGLIKCMLHAIGEVCKA